jgi:hypothetical protein
VNTSSWAHKVGVRGGGPQAQVYANQNGTVHPWAIAGAKLWVEAWVKLPTLSGVIAAPNVSGTVAQLGLEYYARDTVSGKSFAGGGAIWDSRPFGYQCGSEFVASDTYTPFASTPIMPGTKYASAAPGSNHYCNVNTWTDYKYFGFTVSATQLELAATEINKRFPGTNISQDARKYTIETIIYGNEVTGYEAPGNHMSYASAVANLSAWVEVQAASPAADRSPGDGAAPQVTVKAVATSATAAGLTPPAPRTPAFKYSWDRIGLSGNT